MPALERLHHDPVLTVFALGNLCVAVWRDAPRKGQITTVMETFYGKAAHMKDLALANLIVSGTPIFPEDARKEAAALQRDRRARIRATAHVVMVQGFAGAATRAFLSGITLITRTNGHTKVFSQVQPAALWLEGHDPEGRRRDVASGDLLGALEQAAVTPA